MCNGSLGDPVVNITFGSGASTIGQPLANTITSYTFVSQSCPSDGSYTITNNTSGCFSNAWHTLSSDHTPGDANGYMMLVNASYSPGVFYLDTVKNLCGGTTYEFSAWLISVLRSNSCSGQGIQPNITFSIETVDGAVIQSVNTGNISNNSSPQWNQYGLFFTLPVNYTNLVLRLVNNAPGGCGNDLAVDDITFRPCGPKVNTAFANGIGPVDTLNYCFNNNKTITISGSVQAGYINPAYQWQQSIDSGKTWIDIPGATNTDFTNTYSVAGKFQYRMSVAEAGNIGIARCRVSSNALVINIDTIPVPEAISTSPVCVNAALTFFAKNGDFYQWSGPSAFSSSLQSPVIAAATINNAGKYYVLASTKGGCSKLDSTMVTINNLPVANAGKDTAICEGNSITLQASGGILYKWEASASLSDITIANPVANPLTNTSYIVNAGNQFACWNRDTVILTVLKKPIADAGPDKQLLEGGSVILNGVAGGDSSSYYWTPAQFISNSNIKTPVVNPINDITYTFHVVSGNGCCVATDDSFVRLFKKIKIPNAFSPNGDGINDVWNIDALNLYPESETNVFNRYGQLVFHSIGYGRPWDGRFNSKLLSTGTYYYSIDRKNNLPVVTGWLMIIR